MFKNSNHFLMCACVAIAGFSTLDAHAACRAPDMRLYWSSVDEQTEVERDSHILLSFSNTEVVKVTLNGKDLIAEELTKTHASYTHPATTELGAQTLVITLDRDYGDIPEELEFERPEPVVITRSYNLVKSSVHSSDYEMSIVDAQPSAPYKNDTTCDEIFNESNCFDTGEPVIQDLTLSTLDHPYFVEEYATTYTERGKEQVWRPSGFYPKGCTASVENAHGESTCFRIVTIDEQGQRHVGAKQCDIMKKSESSSCTTAPSSAPQPSHPLIWLSLFGMFTWVRRRTCSA